jgi:DNA helicase HerA-like ATPase
LHALGGQGAGIPVRATITSFGPILLSKILGLNDVQESSLGLVFMFADQNGLPLLDLKDLRAVIQHLASDDGKEALAALGGLSKATAGVLLRQLLTFEAQGADAYPKSSYDLAEVLTSMGIGEAVVTVLSDKGVPTPVAWTRLRAPQSLMAEADPAVVQQVISTSPLYPIYAWAIDRESAYEMLAARVAQAQLAALAAPPQPVPTPRSASPRTTTPRTAAPPPSTPRASTSRATSSRATSSRASTPQARQPETLMEQVLGSAAIKGFAQSVGKEITRSIFGTTRRR